VYLLERGYQPILAHPERMGLALRELTAVVRDLRSLGVWLQGNLHSLAGGEGKTAYDRAHQWLRDDTYFTLATDTHEPLGVAGRAAGLALVREYQEPLVHLLLAQRPRLILQYVPEAASNVKAKS
jgi:tyrosine-protein phosphatase YwqE